MTFPSSHSFVAAAAISELQSLVNSSGGSTGHNCAEGAIACDTARSQRCSVITRYSELE